MQGGTRGARSCSGEHEPIRLAIEKFNQSDCKGIQGEPKGVQGAARRTQGGHGSARRVCLRDTKGSKLVIISDIRP